MQHAKLLRRRSRGSGRCLAMLSLGWGRGCSRCFLLLFHLLVMVLVLRGGLVRLGGLSLRLSRALCRRGGGGLRGLLCYYRKRQCKQDERPEDNSK
jgi:hypothetical protein